jgi:hypothetical protein
LTIKSDVEYKNYISNMILLQKRYQVFLDYLESFNLLPKDHILIPNHFYDATFSLMT